jgi:hypothetical protein
MQTSWVTGGDLPRLDPDSPNPLQTVWGWYYFTLSHVHYIHSLTLVMDTLEFSLWFSLQGKYSLVHLSTNLTLVFPCKYWAFYALIVRLPLHDSNEWNYLACKVSPPQNDFVHFSTCANNPRHCDYAFSMKSYNFILTTARLETWNLKGWVPGTRYPSVRAMRSQPKVDDERHTGVTSVWVLLGRIVTSINSESDKQGLCQRLRWHLVFKLRWFEWREMTWPFALRIQAALWHFVTQNFKDPVFVVFVLGIALTAVSLQLSQK